MNNGAFGENFPYSNFHDLNMDWIIKIAKDFLDQYTHIQEVITNGEESLTNLTNDGLAQLQDKADALEALLQEWYNTHSEDIAEQLASALQELDEQLEALLTEFNNRADIKTAQAIASIPSDYTTLSNVVYTLVAYHVNYVLRDGVVPTSSTSPVITNLEIDMSRPNYVKITNTDSSAGYFRPHIYRDGEVITTYSNQLINAGESYTWKIYGFNSANGLWDWAKNADWTQQTFKLALTNTNQKTATYEVYNYTKDEPLKANNIIYVDTIGDNGAFREPISAIYYAKSKINVNTTPVTIFIKSGRYTLQNVTRDNAVINKGANKISIIGENEKTTIIELVNVDSSNNQILNIGGECVIKNLSLYNKHTGTTPSASTNPYCIHNDTPFDSQVPYATVVENCTLYSEMLNPIGGGLRNKQKQVYKNVTCIYNGTLESTQGALYIHSQADANEIPVGLEIDGCTLVSQNSNVCISLPSVISGAYRNIPVRMVHTTGWTTRQDPHYLSRDNINFSPDSNLATFYGNNTYPYALP